MIQLKPRVDGPLTSDEQGIVTRIIEQFPGIDRSPIAGLVRLGYSESDMKDILKALELNASTVNIEPDDPKWITWINRALVAILRRFKDALNNGQYDTLLNAGYIPSEIRNTLFTNLMPITQLLARTAEAHASREYERLRRLGYTDTEIRSFIRASFTVSQLRLLADRTYDAQRNGVDAQGLTAQWINDLLFKDISINGKQTLGIVKALLSGITSKVREGEVARCIIEYTTLFDVLYGLGGADGQVDVGTRHTIVEVKVGSVRAKRLRQIDKILHSDELNPPDASGMRKFVILYAPGYDDAATARIQAIGGHVVKSCEQLRKQIRLLGGP
jgi:hypothetical protein